MQNIQKDWYMCHDKKPVSLKQNHMRTSIRVKALQALSRVSVKSHSLNILGRQCCYYLPSLAYLRFFHETIWITGLKLKTENQRRTHPNLSPQYTTSAPRENIVDRSTPWSRQHLIQTKIIVISPFWLIARRMKNWLICQEHSGFRLVEKQVIYLQGKWSIS